MTELEHLKFEMNRMKRQMGTLQQLMMNNLSAANGHINENQQHGAERDAALCELSVLAADDAVRLDEHDAALCELAELMTMGGAN